MRLIDADALKEEVNKKNVVGRFSTITLIDDAPTVDLGKDGIDIERYSDRLYQNAYKKGYEQGKAESSQGECRTCRHRDPEDKKCDCGAQERQGCPFPVRNNYFCKFYEKDGAE